MKKLGGQTSKEDRLRLAARIVELSDQRLSTHPNPKYVALKIGTGPYSNAFAVRDNRVSCFIRSTDLLSKVKAEGFNPDEAPGTVPMNKDKFYFWGLGLDDVQAHESLFREIVQESVRTIMDRRPKN